MTVHLRIPHRPARRRDDILEAARQLFDREGIGTVRLSHIAAAAHISPGNLYYWFASKDDIVRTLFAQWCEQSGPHGEFPDDPSLVLALLWRDLADQSRVSARFRFFQRELPALLHARPELATIYTERYTAQLAWLGAWSERLLAAGLLREPASRGQFGEVLKGLWLVAENAGPFAEVLGDETLDGARVARAMVRPLLSERGCAVVDVLDAQASHEDEHPGQRPHEDEHPGQRPHEDEHPGQRP